MSRCLVCGLQNVLFVISQQVLAFVDGSTMQVMLPSQDHKRHKDGDVGANTGGMGAYCPCPLVCESELAVVRDRVLQKAVDGLKMEGIPFTGET
jgi:phosphoribosylamine--glycine ligase/phosphoribosylglycinamide formyltransferase/phosphoribosylformylglycinamidine cyclo-ligase